jgi:ABC-type sugar transport system substrate-binding protein
MIDEHHPDIVLAFHSNIKESKGTRDMCYKAKKAGIPVIVIRSDKVAPEPPVERIGL